MIDEEAYYSSVKDWYVAEYPTDEMGAALPDTLEEANSEFFASDIEEDPSLGDEPIKFVDYYVMLENNGDIYELMGGSADSIIRERIFDHLSEILDVSYNDIYNLWLHGN